MKKLFEKFKLSAFFRAFLIVALLFLAIGMGTLGTTQTTGASYEVKSGAEIVFKLSKQTGQTKLKQIYFNVGTGYTELGKTTKISIARASTSGETFYTTNFGTAEFDNVYSENEKAIKDAQFNWTTPYNAEAGSYNISTYPYYKLTATTGNIVINEIIFVADNDTVITATVDDAKSRGIDVKKASALLDAQVIPSASNSAYYRFSNEEVYTLMTVTEMNAGSGYAAENIYHMDGAYNYLGLDLIALGTAIFGVSPFGLRFFPMLASFGILVVGYCLVSALFKSDKAGFAFAVIYALGGFALSFGHLGTPLTIGIFFFLLGLNAVYKFYAKGMNSVGGLINLVVGGIASAASICTHGAFALPVLGIVGLFVAGMLRQQKAKAYYIEKAPEEETEDEEEIVLSKDQVAKEYAQKNLEAIAAFVGGLVFGLVFLTVFSVLPVYSTAMKVYRGANLMDVIWSGIANGYGAGNVTNIAQSGWSFIYLLTNVFAGDKVTTVAASTTNIIALVIGALGLVWACVDLVLSIIKKENLRRAIVSVALPVGVLALAFLTSIFAAQSVLFVMLGYIGCFMAAGYFMEKMSSVNGGAAVLIVEAVLLVAYCVLMLPLIVSLPVAADWVGIFVK